MSEPLEYQVGVYIDTEVYKTPEAQKKAYRRAMRHFLRTGEEINGVRIVARWRNPKNKNPLHSNWKKTTDEGQSLADFHYTLHGQRGALRDLARKYGA
jgi:hypothetical protein